MRYQDQYDINTSLTLVNAACWFILVQVRYQCGYDQDCANNASTVPIQYKYNASTMPVR